MSCLGKSTLPTNGRRPVDALPSCVEMIRSENANERCLDFQWRLFS